MYIESGSRRNEKNELCTRIMYMNGRKKARKKRGRKIKIYNVIVTDGPGDDVSVNEISENVQRTYPEKNGDRFE